MIKFGVRIAPLYSPNFIFQNNGTIIFEGSVTIAENSYLSCNEGGVLYLVIMFLLIVELV